MRPLFLIFRSNSLYANGKMQSLEAGASTKPTSSFASIINDSGLIVGTMTLSSSGGFGGSASTVFAYSGGSLLNLNSITSGLNDTTLYDVFSLTKNGSILAVGTDAKGGTHLVLLTPTAGVSKAVSPAGSHRGAPAAGVPTSSLPQWFLKRHAHDMAASAK